MGLFRQSCCLLLSVLLSCAPAFAQGPGDPPAQGEKTLPDDRQAQKAAQQGEKAEAAGRLDEALAAYETAARYAPDDTNVVEHAAVLRSKVIRSHSEAAERAALEGHLDRAAKELATALGIDPGNAIVAERLSQIKAMETEPQAAASNEISGLPRLQPRTGKQKVDLRGDTRSVYEQLAALFGIKVTFDPDLMARTVHLHVDNVDFYTALSVLMVQTTTFWRPLTATTMFVSADTQEKRRQFALVAEQTFPLTGAVSAEDATDILRVLRDMTGATHLQLDAHTRTITMRDTPEKLALAGELIRQIDRARGEVMVEIELLEVDKNKARDLGILPPSSTQLIPLTQSELNLLKSSTDFSNLLTNLQQVFTASGLSGVPSVIPVGGGLSTFLLTLPSLTANFSDTLSLVQSGRQVLLRAQDGKPATFFVGDRYPVTLSLLSGSLGGGSLSSLSGALSGVNFPETQFAVGVDPSALVANNFTGGTLPDLAVVFNNANTHTFTILQNQDNGSFAQLTPAPITLGANETGQVAIETGIFRNDASKFSTAQPPDVVLVNSTSKNISVLLGNAGSNGVGNGTFTEAPGSPITVGTNPSSVVLADFNGDGFLDLAVANQGDNSISLFEGHGDGTFTEFPASPFKFPLAGTPAEDSPVAMVSGNFQNKTISASNGSPEVDLAIVNRASNNVTILLSSVDQNNNVTFTEAPNSPIAVGQFPVAIATGDMNGDGIPDLAVVNQNDATVTILLGSSNLDGTFTQATGSPLATGLRPAGIVIASFAGGAVPDIAVTNENSSTLGVYLNLGQAAFAPRIELNTPVGPSALITSTLTSSGLPDVALVAQDPSSSQGVVAIIQDSSNFASTATSGGLGQTPYPGSEYIDLGVKIKVTPVLHAKNEVTLQLEFEIRALSGTAINGIPIISNRTLSQTARVKEDQPSLIAGLTDREETRSITGLPGFAELPVAGYAFGTRSNSLQDTELLILVTPRKVRLADRLARTIFAGRGDPGQGRVTVGTGGGSEAPPQPPPGQPGRPGEPAQPSPTPPPAQRPREP
jgi:type II secretory pathway component GspD/PulD (secretin)